MDASSWAFRSPIFTSASRKEWPRAVVYRGAQRQRLYHMLGHSMFRRTPQISHGDNAKGAPMRCSYPRRYSWKKSVGTVCVTRTSTMRVWMSWRNPRSGRRIWISFYTSTPPIFHAYHLVPLSYREGARFRSQSICLFRVEDD